MPDPYPLRPEETEAARLRRLVEEFCLRRGIYMGHEAAIVWILKLERRDAMEKAAGLMCEQCAGSSPGYEEKVTHRPGWKLGWYHRSTGDGEVFIACRAAAIRREMGE